MEEGSFPDFAWILSLEEGLGVDNSILLETGGKAEYACGSTPTVSDNEAVKAEIQSTNTLHVEKTVATKGKVPRKCNITSRNKRNVAAPATLCSLPNSLRPSFWIMRMRGELCTSEDCSFTNFQGISRRKHFHPRCDHRHKTGVNAGKLFTTSHVDKAIKHQKLHPELP